MKAPVRPRALVHRGAVAAAGFLFDTALLGEAEARRRVVALWTPGATVQRTEHGLVLRTAAPVRVVCDRAPGGVLTLQGEYLAAAPLAPDELGALGAPAGAAVLVRDGGAVPVPLDARSLEDPATWIDVAAFAPVALDSLGAPPPPPLVVDASAASMRDVFGDGILAPGAEVAAVRDAVLRVLAGLEPPAPPVASPAPRVRWAAVLFALVSSAAARLAARFAPTREPPALPPSAAPAPPPYRGADGAPPPVPPAPAATTSRTASRGATETAPAPARRALALASLWAALRSVFAHTVMASPVGAHVGARQARYLAEMLELFERGALDDALRRAVPLRGDGADTPRGEPSLRVPAPRADLRITRESVRRGAGSLGVDESVFDRMKKAYRAAFVRLDREGRVEEAAFVLVELLGQTAEAVSYLEAHGRLRTAAEIAEARGLPPEQVVRLWLLAGDRARGVRIARRTGCFAAAVALLARSSPTGADALRVLWADTLAAAGDYLAAVDALWPVVSQRARATPWLERAIARGGVGGARALARMLSLFPDADVTDSVRALLDDPDAARARAVFADGLVVAPKSPRTQGLARAVVRALVRDEPSGEDARCAGRIRAVADYAGSGALRADLPPAGAVVAPHLAERCPPRRLVIAADDAGTARVHDVLRLPDGRIAVALGEAGVRVLSRGGATLARLDQPAESLVASDHGDRAIALARRGGVFRLARLDFAALRASYWCDARITAFAPDYDGDLWFVAADDALLVVDAAAPGFTALFRAVEHHARVTAVARDARRVSALLELLQEPHEPAPPGFRRWTFELPGPTLRESVALSLQARDGAITPAGDIHSPAGLTARSPFAGGNPPVAVAATGAWVAAQSLVAGATEVVLLDVPTMTERARVRLERTVTCVARLQGDALLVGDARGRLVGIELAHGRTLFDLRV